MDLGDDFDDPFKVKDLWQPSRFALQPLKPLEPITWESTLPEIPKGVFDTHLHVFDNNESLLYEINVFGTEDTDASIPEPEPDPADNILETDTNETTGSEVNSNEADNIWGLESLELPTGSQPNLRSWDSFLNSEFQEPVSAYLSEFGNKGFDAALSHQATVSGLENAGRLIRTSVFLDSLLRLGLGWNSMLFHYNEGKRMFEKSIRDIRISGIELATLDSMVGDILKCGTHMQRMRRFVRNNPSLSDQPSALTGLASAASIMIYSLEKQLSKQIDPRISLIQIQSLFRNCGDLVSTLADIISAAEKATNENEIISVLLEICETQEQRFPWLSKILHEIVQKCIKPWLVLVESWVGLRSDKPLLAEGQTNRRSFVEWQNSHQLGENKLETASIEYIYHPEMMPSSLPDDQARLIFETGKALRLLKENQPDHPISREDVVENSRPPGLTCAFLWTDIEQIQQKAADYENQLRREILRYHKGDTSRSRPATRSGDTNVGGNEFDGASGTEEFELIDLDSGRHITGVLANNDYVEADNLYLYAEENDLLNPNSSSSTETAFGPPLGSVLYLSLAPTLAVQAQLVDFSCLHLLFKRHQLQHHLNLQWRFQLLGDGVFASRLSHSLFDPELSSGERKSGVARGGFNTGLRLGSRDTWPPASSELRLVLMGLLTECHAAIENKDTLSMQPEAKDNELPGGLSFSIRELSGAELIKCKDPNAIEALDFLRLQYKPPAVLESVITTRSLEKYDRLFKHLLRLVRMVSVVNGLVRDSTARSSLSGDTHNIFQKFRVDSYHVIGALNDYFFQIGIGSNWKRFESTLSKIKSCLDRGDIDETIEIAGSLYRLRQYHEDILDQILFSLFLSKRHEQVNKLLEEMFGTILAFAPLSRLDGSHGIRQQNEKTVHRLYATFRKQMSVFVRFLRGLDGGKMAFKSTATQLGGSSSMSIRTTSSIFEYLLARLDLKQYY
ncbi:putative gamma-tubulin complex component GCP6 [Talaromyces proteolyticus]|uniref:Spindle pole body component n=1 Tax=Talaromyces proteolyticus TaxID=1131652 RepID=A0AAD4Q1D6_9EURO|nr:putative gamma-tubulin complex component GCP6 [Talaromyces proteolyticus]KAH8698428.1 putative gamma-tubulin complex component GCP6 [Talaromyces proteolyticus]